MWSLTCIFRFWEQFTDFFPFFRCIILTRTWFLLSLRRKLWRHLRKELTLELKKTIPGSDGFFFLVHTALWLQKDLTNLFDYADLRNNKSLFFLKTLIYVLNRTRKEFSSAILGIIDWNKRSYILCIWSIPNSSEEDYDCSFRFSEWKKLFKRTSHF